MRKKITIGVFALLLMLGSVSSASAATTYAELQLKISVARENYNVLKAEVDAGTLTVEEARAQWQTVLEDLHAEKKELFDQRMNTLQEKYEKFAENNPERSETVKLRLEALADRNTAREEKRIEIKARVESGEITNKEAARLRVDFLNKQKDTYVQVKQEIKSRQQENRQERAENRYIKIDDIKGEARDSENNARLQRDVNAGTNVKADAKVQLRLDPTGMNALQVFPGAKADIQAAVDARANTATDYNSSRSNKSY